jgi:hypothetical protein
MALRGLPLHGLLRWPLFVARRPEGAARSAAQKTWQLVVVV